jgi:hypothetical protein
MTSDPEYSHILFDRLIEAVQLVPREFVQDMLRNLQQGGRNLAVFHMAEDPLWENEEVPLVVVRSEVKLGAVRVAEWRTDYTIVESINEWGIEARFSTIPDGLEKLLTYAGITTEAPFSYGTSGLWWRLN